MLRLGSWGPKVGCQGGAVHGGRGAGVMFALSEGGGGTNSWPLPLAGTGRGGALPAVSHTDPHSHPSWAALKAPMRDSRTLRGDYVPSITFLRSPRLQPLQVHTQFQKILRIRVQNNAPNGKAPPRNGRRNSGVPVGAAGPSRRLSAPQEARETGGSCRG